MTATHQSGPHLVYGYNPQTGGDYNADAGPSCGYQGDCILDVRYPFAAGYQSFASGAVSGVQWSGFFNSPYVCMVDAVPSTIATANIAALQHTTASTALTLVSSTGAGITVTTAGAVAAKFPMAGTAPGIKALASSTVLLAIDGLYSPTVVGPQVIHDPTTALARCVSLTSSANMSANNITIKGFDIFGYAMTQTLAGPNANTVNTTKAFKYILSVTPSATDGTNNISIGTSDIYGLHLRSDKWEYMNVFWNGAFVTANTGWTAADTTNPATVSTGDTRGTYLVQSVASNGVRRLAMFMSIPLAAAIAATPSAYTSLYGIAQV